MLSGPQISLCNGLIASSGARMRSAAVCATDGRKGLTRLYAAESVYPCQRLPKQKQMMTCISVIYESITRANGLTEYIGDKNT
jgi:hypothetical protein